MKERLVGLDALRATLILFGIPFHAALPYAEGAMGLLHADETSGTVGLLVLLLRTFRMPTFFIVAGLFAALILKRRSPEAWLRERARRLAIPLIFGVVVLEAPMRMLVRAYREASGLAIGTPMSSFYHLWFLVTLLALCVAVYAVRPWLDRALDRLGAALGRCGTGFGEVALLGLVGLAVLWQFAVHALFDIEITRSLPLVGTVHITLTYAPWFFFGYGLGRVAGGIDWFARLSPSSMLLAGGFVILDVLVAETPNFEAESFAHLAAWTGAAFYLGRVLVMIATRLPFAGSRPVRRVVDHSMAIYLVHYPWAMVFALLLVPAHWSGGAEFLVVTALTAVATLATCVLLSKSAILSFLVDGRRRDRATPTPPAAVTA